MRRAVNINEAITTLNIPYTYTLLRNVTPEKANARKTLGMMSAEMLVNMRDELLEKAWDDYKRSKE